MRPYARDQVYSLMLADKIIQKVMEEHNYITIYCKLVKRLKGATVATLGDKCPVATPGDKFRSVEVEGAKPIKSIEAGLKFKSIVVERLQLQFNILVRKG